MADAMQALFTSQEIRTIKTLLEQQGLYNPIDGRVIDTTRSKDNPSVGKFKPIYDYIYAVLSTKSGVDSDTMYWFSQAGAINQDDTTSSADDYIRGLTQYGLQFNKKIDGLSQDQINKGIQATSNLVGQKVIDTILADGGVPNFNVLLSDDINAAIGGNNGLDSHFQQDVGGWGGSFYYWNRLLNYGTNYQTISVGDVIENGGVVAANNKPSLQQQSIDEFYYSNSNAMADFAITKAYESMTPSQRANAKANSGSEDGKAALRKAEWEFFSSDSFGSGWDAQCPTTVKLSLLKQAEGILCARFEANHFSGGPHTPSLAHHAKRQVGASVHLVARNTTQTVHAADTQDVSGITTSPNGVTTAYSDGTTITQDLNIGDGTEVQWTDAYGDAGEVTATSTATGIELVDKNSDGSTDVFDIGANGYTEMSTYTDSSVEKQWQSADGSSGDDYKRSDGSGSSNTIGTDGTKTVSTLGAGGILTSCEIYHTDGSGSKTSYFGNGQIFQQRIASANGSRTDTNYYDNGQTETVSRENPDGTGSGEWYGSDGFLTSKYAVNEDGSINVVSYNRDGSWAVNNISPDNSQSNTGYWADGDVASVGIVNSDGSASTKWYADHTGQLTADWETTANGVTTKTLYDAQGNVSSVNESSIQLTAQVVNGDTTTDTQYWGDGGVKSATSVSADGTTQTDDYNAAGALLQEIITHPDGSKSITTTEGIPNRLVWMEYDTKTIYADGTIDDTRYFDANVASESLTAPNEGGISWAYYVNPNGKVGKTENRQADGEIDTTLYSGNGESVDSSIVNEGGISGANEDVKYNALGQQVADSWTDGTGSSGAFTFRTDGSDAGKIVDANGNYTTYVDDGSGNDSETEYLAGGALATSVSEGATVTNADGSVTTTFDDHQGDVSSSTYGIDGKELNDTWRNADGSHGSDVFSSNGASSGSSTRSDGSSTDYIDDGKGDVTESDYGAAGTKQDDLWRKADGSSGSDIFNSDGSMTANVDDGVGGTLSTNYGASGAKTGDSWTHADGSKGTDTYSIDGSSASTIDNADGTSVAVTTDAKGNKLSKLYGASGVETSDSWANADGSSGTDTFDSNGKVTADTWSHADGTNGSDLYNNDGSKVSTYKNADGSYSVATTTASGVTTTVYYDADGRLANGTGASPTSTHSALPFHIGTGAMSTHPTGTAIQIQLGKLVQAMSSFSAPAAGMTCPWHVPEREEPMLAASQN